MWPVSGGSPVAMANSITFTGDVTKEIVGSACVTVHVLFANMLLV